MRAMTRAEGPANAAGIDAGATLTKLALPSEDGSARLEALPSEQTEAILAKVEAAAPAHVGLTGGGAKRLLARIPAGRTVDEFDAWHAGVQDIALEVGERFLLVSIGTGTSVLLVDGPKVQRLGGTPLGGGTVLGLGKVLAGTSDFEALCAMAERGDRARVDLSVADVYAGGDAPLTTDVMASSFARLADGAHHANASPEDCARSLMAMVGENVALLAGSLSLVVDAPAIAFGGSTVTGNPALAEALRDYVGRFGRKTHLLDHGGFIGALGARRLAVEP